MANPLAADLDSILAQTPGIWDEFRGRRIFITGGTGFFGCWLLESFIWANERLKLGASATVLTRDPAAFAKKCPHLANCNSLAFCHGDVIDFAYPDGRFSHVIHAATESSTQLVVTDPARMSKTILDGTRRTLDFARQAGATKILFTSSGAVYGRQPPEMTHISETCDNILDSASPNYPYAEGKRGAEVLCEKYSREHGMEIKIARCFAFVGPYLPLDAHFAIGNFILNAMSNAPIVVKGDGTPYRSYLYAADLAVWLWTILALGQSVRRYNVGSESALTIRDLAETVACCVTPRVEVQIAKTPAPGVPAERYVPSTQRARSELKLKEQVDLKTAVHNTIKWHRALSQ